MNKHDRAYVLYANENYFEIVNQCAKSIREFSSYPIFVYILNSDLKINLENTYTIRWDVDLDNLLTQDSYYTSEDSNFYIRRDDVGIYKLLIQRPQIIRDALLKYANTVAYVDSDSVATNNCDRIFEIYDQSKPYPYFTEGIFEWMRYGTRGGAWTRDDLSTTLEHPICELLNIDQYVRQNYRQTGYFVAGQNTIDFLEEWYWMCLNPTISKDPGHYAPYHEETIVNILLWKHKYFDGFPYIYMNANSDTIDDVYTKYEFNGEAQYLGGWTRLPARKEDLLFFHGEKRPEKMEEMLQKIIDYNYSGDRIRLLFIAPHLSTGGMPSFLLKRIECILEHCPEIEIFLVEFSDFSPTYVVQKNKIKKLIPSNRFWTLGTFHSTEDEKMYIMDIIKKYKIDIVHVDEIMEGFESFNQVPQKLFDALYAENRTWKIVETCHNIWFNPKTSKRYHPDAYAFCTPYHKEVSFSSMPSYSEVLNFPIDRNFRTRKEQLDAQLELGLDVSKIHIVNVGIWTSGKNQGEGVEIARLLADANPEFQFHFVGSLAPNFVDYYEPIISNLPKNVVVWGERDDVDRFMKAADIFMFNSTWECNPIVLREAISYGLKILSRNLPQYMDMFTNYIYEINDDIYKTRNLILSLTNKERTYDISETQSKEFGLNHLSFYKKVLEINPQKNNNLEYNITINQHFVGQPFIEILGTGDKKYTIKFFDEKNVEHYSNTLSVNTWVKLNREYYTEWRTEIWEDENLFYNKKLDLKNKRVYISFESSSLGDNIAWIPYCLEFQKKHDCKVIVSTFKNFLFRNVYPELEFVEPGQVVNNLYAMYKLGWFYDTKKEPMMPNIIPLQKAATNILGLDFEELKPRIDYQIGQRPLTEKYVTIATNSTAGCKFWTKEGWQELINYLNKQGYKVINVSKEKNPFTNAIQIKDTSMEYTMNVIHHSEFLVGLSSGLSWLAWGMGKHVVMISNFTESDHEFTSNCTRITNKNVCNGCWNNPNYTFDKGDWYWCPVHKGTNRQFECHTSITSEMVINQIKHLI